MELRKWNKRNLEKINVIEAAGKRENSKRNTKENKRGR